jgi:hypothetical protein
LESEPDVIPCILTPEQLYIEKPLFDESMVIDPCG